MQLLTQELLARLPRRRHGSNPLAIAKYRAASNDPTCPARAAVWQFFVFAGTVVLTGEDQLDLELDGLVIRGEIWSNEKLRLSFLRQEQPGYGPIELDPEFKPARLTRVHAAENWRREARRAE